jgi:hypothetical protein
MNKSRPIPADYLQLWREEKEKEEEEEEGSKEYYSIEEWEGEEVEDNETGFSERLGKWETLKFPEEMFPTTVKVGWQKKKH